MNEETNQNRQVRLYRLLTIVTGSLIFVLSAIGLDRQVLDLRFCVIAVLTIFLSSRILIPIPRFSSHISVSDTFIFLVFLLYGPNAAVLLAATEALMSSFRFSRKPSTILFNWGAAAWATGITALVLKVASGDIVRLTQNPISPRFALAISMMALAQYASNSVLVTICGALKSGASVWQTWKKYYLWTWITYSAGASAAAIIAQLTNQVGFYALIITLPIIAIVFLTYRTYLKNIEASAKQAEQAEQHIQELSHYISEQERIREQFSQLEKLSALGELASGVAHDFNNTLAGILARAQLLLRTNDPAKIERGLNIIIKTAEDGAKTVKRIQDFARQRRDHDFEPVSIAQILSDVSEMTSARWKDQAEATNIHIKMKLQLNSESKVMGDESELRDVLVNMVLNAVDAMPDGGNLTLAANEVGNYVVVKVADDGVGMSAEVRSRIFDPFFTTKGKAGMGLGLAVSFGIIRRHEGTIEVESAVGRGTTFRIKLPIAELGNQEATATTELSIETTPRETYPARTRRTLEHQPNILVVDDEQHVRELLQEILEGEGCRVYLASGGREAMALMDARDFQGVFTDIGMPGMSGWELAQAIRQRADIPIAVVTGWGEAVGSDEQKEAAVNWVVTKPFRAERIAELVNEITRVYSGVNCPPASIVAA
jgi:signal transduction histidine kinase/ActR/RegA family two-component response regulator